MKSCLKNEKLCPCSRAHAESRRKIRLSKSTQLIIQPSAPKLRPAWAGELQQLKSLREDLAFGQPTFDMPYSVAILAEISYFARN